MRALVVGAGAWGLPAAATLARRGHTVTLLERHGVGNQLSSSSGPTRIWRLAHPDVDRVVLALRAVAAWRRLERDTARTVLLHRGLLWRDDVSVPWVEAALRQVGVQHELLDPDDVGRAFPGLRPDGRPAVWQPEAGPLLAAEALAAQQDLLARAGGVLVEGDEAVGLNLDGDGVRVESVVEGGERRSHEADVVVLAPGPGAPAMVAALGLDLPLRPVLEQVCYVDGPGARDLPSLFDGPDGERPGLYAMATPGAGPASGYKIGLDEPLTRAYDPGDRDRSADPEVDARVGSWVAAALPGLDPTVRAAQVCTWTWSPDGRFVLDRLHDGRVVLACGDSGEGFKFSALMGEILADLAEGAVPAPEVAAFGLQRFAGQDLSGPVEPPTLGR